MMKGILISFEGIDGSGKSTQSKKLYHWLKKEGYKTIHLEEPGGTNVGEKLRKILLYAEKISEFSELFLFLASRAQLVKEVIFPSLREGKIVIIDRFSDSTLAYQGYGRGLNKSLITRLNKIVTGGITPNLTLLLDRGPKFSLKKTRSKRDKFEDESLAFRQRVREGYHKIALSHQKRVKTISVRADETQTFQEIKKVVIWKLKELNVI